MAAQGNVALQMLNQALSGGGGIGGSAGSLDAPGDLGSLSPGQSASQSQGSSSGQTYFQDPNLVKALSALSGGVANQTGSQYNQFVSDPTSSPIFQNALSGLLGSLKPSEDAARRNLSDTFRAAGNTASSTFAKGASGLESDILRNRQTTGSQLLTSLFPQVAQALYQPLSQIPSLIDANKLQENEQQQSSSQGGYSYSPATGQKVQIPGYTAPEYSKLANRGSVILQ